MRSLILGAAATLMLAGAAGADPPGPASGPYAWDASGVCHDASGTQVKESLCPARPHAKTQCTDPHDSSRLESCSMPGAQPVQGPASGVDSGTPSGGAPPAHPMGPS